MAEKNEISYVDRIGIPQVTLAEAYEQLLDSLECASRAPIILVGESGLGKTQIFKMLERVTGYKVHPVNTAHFNMMGGGVPQRTDTDFFKIAVPDIYPKPGEKAILLFDELNRGAKHAVDLFFTLIEDRRQFNYILPEDCPVFGTMNPDTAQYAVTAIERDPAMRRRVKFLYVIPDYKGWLAHASSEHFHAGSRGVAKGKPCHPNLLAFFRAHPTSLYDHRSRDAGKQYMCPATAETISEDCWNIQHKGKHSMHEDYAFTRFSGSVNTAMAKQICEYIRDSSTTISAEDVLLHYEDVKQRVLRLKENSGQAQLAELAANVLHLLFATKPEVEKIAANFVDFLTDLPRDQTVATHSGMADAAQKTNSKAYLRQLIVELQGCKAWEDLQTDIDQTHRSMANGLANQGR